MPRIELNTPIHAPPERVFDLARSIDLHIDSTAGTRERAVAGVTSGLIGLDQEVTWRARHLGVWWNLTSRITEFNRPLHFTDVQTSGPFRRLEHHHFFDAVPEGVIMRDVFTFESPWGLLGRLANRLFLERHLRKLLTQRNRVIHEAAETNAWRKYLGG